MLKINPSQSKAYLYATKRLCNLGIALCIISGLLFLYQFIGAGKVVLTIGCCFLIVVFCLRAFEMVYDISDE